MENILLPITVVLSLVSAVTALLVFLWTRKVKLGDSGGANELEQIDRKIDLLKESENTANKVLLDWADKTTSSLEARITSLQNETRENLSKVQKEVEFKLKEIREGNEKQLEKMRETVNEKISETLKQKLDLSFSNVSSQLSALQTNLGEMKVLTENVTDLNILLSNNKTKGMWGEVALEMIIGEIFPPELYERQVTIKKGKREKVDFVIILPGTSGSDRVLLPIDAKFLTQDYKDLLESRAKGDKVAIEKYTKSLASAVKNQAKDIAKKYINPPETTDFALMYLPSEGLYAEVANIPKLTAELHKDHKILLAGPTTISAIFQSLSVGFKTLQIQKNSLEMINLIKTFSKEFTALLTEVGKTKAHLIKAISSVETTEKKSQDVKKSLDSFESLDSSEALSPGDFEENE